MSIVRNQPTLHTCGVLSSRLISKNVGLVSQKAAELQLSHTGGLERDSCCNLWGESWQLFNSHQFENVCSDQWTADATGGAAGETGVWREGGCLYRACHLCMCVWGWWTHKQADSLLTNSEKLLQDSKTENPPWDTAAGPPAPLFVLSHCKPSPACKRKTRRVNKCSRKHL